MSNVTLKLTISDPKQVNYAVSILSEFISELPAYLNCDVNFSIEKSITIDIDDWQSAFDSLNI